MNWKQKKLGDIAILDRRSIHPSNIKSGTLYLGLEHLDSDGEITCSETVNSADLKSSKFQFSDRHILYGKLRPYLRKIVRPDFEGICSTDIIPILPGDELSRDYLFHFLRTTEMVELATARSSGANLPRLSPKQLSSFQIPLPPLAEQKRIAGILDAADALRAKRRESLALLDTLIQSTFLDMFGDPVTNPMGWETCSLHDVTIKITDGTHKTPIYTQSGVEFLSAKDLKDGNVRWESDKFISLAEHKQLIKRCNPELGDLLLAKSGSLGSVAVINRDHKFSLFESLCLIKHDREKIEASFLAAMIKCPSMQTHLLGKNKGIAIKHLHLVDVRQLKILIPSLDLQSRFAGILKSIEEQKDRQRSHLLELNALFTSLQHRAFNGEL